jgi:hypothetical protein
LRSFANWKNLLTVSPIRSQRWIGDDKKRGILGNCHLAAWKQDYLLKVLAGFYQMVH